MTETMNRRQMLKATSAGLLTLAAGHSLQAAATAQSTCSQCSITPPREPELKLYEVESVLGGSTWYAAGDELAAIRMHAEPIRATVSCERNVLPRARPGLPDSSMFFLLIPSRSWSAEDKGWSRITVDQEAYIVTEVPPDTILPVYSDEDGKTHLRTASEWASDGPGFVACSDY